MFPIKKNGTQNASLIFGSRRSQKGQKLSSCSFSCCDEDSGRMITRYILATAMSAWERRCQDAAENQIPVPPYRTLNCWPSFFTERTFNPGIRGVGPVGLLSQKKEKIKKIQESGQGPGHTTDLAHIRSQDYDNHRFLYYCSS